MDLDAIAAEAAANRKRLGILTPTEVIAALPTHNLSELAEATDPGPSRYREVLDVDEVTGESALRREAIPNYDKRRADWLAAQALVQKWTQRFARGPHTRPLRPVQAAILELASRQAQHEALGLLAQVGVGRGKSLAFMLLPEVFDAQRPILMLPPDMVEQTLADRFEWGKEYRFRPVDIVPYSKLSHHESTALLRKKNPDLVMADECQALANSKAARTRRLHRLFESNPAIRFVGMTGTLSTRDIRQYAELAFLALRDGSPLPANEDHLDHWAAILNPGGKPTQSSWVTFAPLCPAVLTSRGTKRRGLARQAYRKRLGTTPGFLLTKASSCAAQLLLRRESPVLSDDVHEAIRVLQQEYRMPDGTDEVDAVAIARAVSQLSMGFYYVWDWPDGKADEEWVNARRDWAGVVRDYLSGHAREGCDSPFLVEQELRLGRIESDIMTGILATWDAQREKPPPPVKPIWLDYGPLLHAIAWSRQRKRAFLWFQSRAVGEMLNAFGIPAFWSGRPDPGQHPIAALSITVYHKGKNFQAWNDQLILEPPPNPATWEQLLGRTHRQGQTAAQVYASIYQHTDPFRTRLTTAQARAEYVQATTGQLQKLLHARWQ